MDSEDGQLFIKRLASYVRTHERALANALQIQRRPNARRASVPASPGSSRPPLQGHTSSFSISSLTFSQNLKPVKLSLTPHHLYYLLSRFEELNIGVGPMNVRLESIHADTAPGNYVSFLRDSSTRIGHRNRSSDSLSIRSVSSVRSVMSGISGIWSTFGFSGSIVSREEKAKAALEADLKYLYSAFTKLPCLKLGPDRKMKLIEGYEEFPFDTAVPLLAFKNLTALEISDIDIRQFFGWDKLSEQLRSLVVKRGNIEDPAELLISIVLDDMDRRRRRSAKTQSSPIISYSHSNSASTTDFTGSISTPPSPSSQTPGANVLSQTVPSSHFHRMSRSGSNRSNPPSRPRSSSPTRPAAIASKSQPAMTRKQSQRMRRSGSGSSHSSAASTVLASAPQPPVMSLPVTKWRFLRHLSLADNSLTSISSAALIPLAGSLTSLDLSSNLFVSVPESLSILTNLRALNLSGCMIDSLHSLTKCPLPAITALNLRGNRLQSLAGVEKLLPLERLDLRENRLTDPMEMARLTGIPNLSEIWVASNPFTKTHSNYRVTIFNLFRTTPGFIEDITLDSQGPGMLEKRSLVERVGEPPSVPVVHQIAPLEAKKDKMEPEKVVATTEIARAKKKAGRRRVVELTRDDSNNHSPVDTSDTRSVRTIVRTNTNVSQKTIAMPPTSKPQRMMMHTTMPHDTPPLNDETSSGAESSPPNYYHHHPSSLPSSSSEPAVDWTTRGEEYRRKVEALKNEVGSGWLSVLSEEGLSLASARPEAFHHGHNHHQLHQHHAQRS
ncbi:hypothetical protein EX30DRAFT_355543 [Ascodesmis nigricans]|uniref:L domain-like protein n=1 Tax=Ascodesmis nigricans TaxID=341454 RepID=A0A4S2MTV7_9PEZI|nr:hypothetical protein EX30DRAFT_355543 [Ascodesmis nigricans]